MHSWKMIFFIYLYRRSKVMRAIGLLAFHCTELKEDVPITEVSACCVTIQDGHATILKHVGEIAMKTSRCHCSIAIACLFSPPRRKNAKQNLFPALLKRKSNFFYKTSVLLLCSASNRLSKNSFPCLAIQMPQPNPWVSVLCSSTSPPTSSPLC